MGQRRKRAQQRQFITREQKTLPQRVQQIEIICDALARCVGVKKMTNAIAERLREDRGDPAPKAPGLFARAVAKLRGGEETEPEVAGEGDGDGAEGET